MKVLLVALALAGGLAAPALADQPKVPEVMRDNIETDTGAAVNHTLILLLAAIALISVAMND